MDLEMEFEVTMMPVLADCSRQRLRSFCMSLLKYGSNINERVTIKEVIAAFQESNIKLPGRAMQLISEVYLDSKGIDFHRLYKRLETAQSKTGRDSVRARQLLGDRRHYNQISEEAKDADFLRRIEEQLVQCQHYFELESYRAGCLRLDTSRTGRLSLDQMKQLAREHALPIYGALLTNLLNRCDDEKNGYTSWPEFMNFLTKAMETYSTNNLGKPKLGTNKPRLEQGSVITKVKRNSVCFNEPGLSSYGTFQKPTVSGVAHKLVSSKEHKVPGQVPANENHIIQERSVPDPSDEIDLRLSQEDSKVPTKEFVINGKPVRLVMPSNFQQSSQPIIDPPQQRLKLDWVYGYNGKGVKNNLHMVSNGDLLYVVGHMAVLFNHKGHKQRHYKEHTAFITSISVHGDRIRVATSQSRYLLGSAQIRIWRSDNLQTVGILEDETHLVNTYSSLMFCVPHERLSSSLDSATRSAYCNQLLVGEQRDSVHVSVWDIGTQSKLATTPVKTDKLCCLGFNPVLPLSVVTLGKEHFQWWKFDRAKKRITPEKEPNFGGPIAALTLLRNCLLTSGKNGVITLWKYGYHLDRIIDIGISLPSVSYGNSLLYFSDILLVGTATNSIMVHEIHCNSHGMPRNLMLFDHRYAQGVAGDIVSMATFHDKDNPKLVICSGSSGDIILYDTERQEVVASTIIPDVMLTSMAVSASGVYLLVGTQKGTVMLYQVEVKDEFVLKKVAVKTLSKSKVGLVSVSPKGSLISAVCHCTVYLLAWKEGEDNENELTQIGKFKTPSYVGPVTLLDWSVETNNGSHILRLFSMSSLQTSLWDPLKMEMLTSLHPLHSCSWSTHKLPLLYTTAGVWYSKQCIEDGLQCIDVNIKKKLIAVCSKQGYLCLFRYPCTTSGAFSHTYRCHIQPGDILFSSPSLVLTHGSIDSCIMQWKLL
ncbi:echinoderm microtubule-associated protein-like 2 [Watersipora subatra]|uniref:echinoderm microtubule-associated protein-like 2 n=1 Tax=Watersipora subatra TaxID=2589382 RepID=UPI00355C9307